MMLLTKKQIEVQNLLIQGLSNKAIGEKLNMKEKTVKFHLTAIYKKQLVKTRTELICKVLKNTF